MRVGLFDGEALEETLVDGIEKMLFLGPVIQCAGRSLDGNIETVERAFKVVAIEGATGQGRDDILNFGGNDVAAREIRIVEDGAEKPFGQEVLHQHLIDGLAANRGVKRGATKREKGGKCLHELPIFRVFLADTRQQALREVRDTLAKFIHCLLKRSDIWFSIAEKLTQQVG